MSADKHTAEPWLAKDSELTTAILNGTGTFAIAGTYSFIGKAARESGKPDRDVRRANARRIVAAINACAGICTEALEEAAGFTDPWHRLGCLRDLCEIERAIVSREPRR
jgi:hypothetical protein